MNMTNTQMSKIMVQYHVLSVYLTHWASLSLLWTMKWAGRAQSKLFKMIDHEFEKEKEKFWLFCAFETLLRISSLQKNRINVKCKVERFTLSPAFVGSEHSTTVGLMVEEWRTLPQRASPWGGVLEASLFTLALCTLGFLSVLLPGRWRSQWYCLLLPLLWLKGLWFYNCFIKILGLFSIISSLYPFIRGHDDHYIMETKPSLTWA